MKILLAVSGGIDSMYLANRAPEIFPGASFAVAHCNFQLRGDESDGDEAFVREWCDTHGMQLYCRRFDTSGYADTEGISIEMAARDLRYGWFAELCRTESFDATAVAHNANDNAETLMLNMLRGCGSRGCRGMSEDSTLLGDPAIRLLRPMLGIERKDIRRWMESKGHGWREDSTNAESDCKRNILRNDVFPLLGGINPSFIQTLGEDMRRLRQADDISQDYFESALKDVRVAEDRYSVTALLSLKHWKYVLWRILEGSGINADTFGKMVELLEKYACCPAGTVTLSGKKFEARTVVVSFEGKRMVIVRR